MNIKNEENLSLNKVLFYVLYHYIQNFVLDMWEVWDFHKRFSTIKMPRNLVRPLFQNSIIYFYFEI